MRSEIVTSASTPVLSHSQANQVVGSKMQMILNNYDLAVECLHKCETVSGIAGWASAAEAYEFWAKMKEDERAINEATAFKKHCMREFGLLAIRLKGTGTVGGRGCRDVGASGWLQQQGFRRNQAAFAVKLGKIPEKEYKESINDKVSLHKLANKKYSIASDAISKVIGASRVMTSTAAAEGFSSRNHHLAENTLKRLDEAIEWLTKVRSELMRLTSVGDA